MSGDKEGAEIAYRSCLAQHPDHGMASHLLAAMTGAKTIRAPKNYVRDLFDDYAETFDKDLVSDLNYVVPPTDRECRIGVSGNMSALNGAPLCESARPWLRDRSRCRGHSAVDSPYYGCGSLVKNVGNRNIRKSYRRINCL